MNSALLPSERGDIGVVGRCKLTRMALWIPGTTEEHIKDTTWERIALEGEQKHIFR